MRIRPMRPVTALAALVALACVATFVACTLNPQPLPPVEFGGDSTSDDGGSRADSSGFGGTPAVPAEDAATGTPSADIDGGKEGGDRTDGGDAGDGGDSGLKDASDDGG